MEAWPAGAHRVTRVPPAPAGITYGCGPGKQCLVNRQGQLSACEVT